MSSQLPQIPGYKRRAPIPPSGSRLPGFGIIGRFFGNAISAAAGFAFGVAAAPILSPAVEDLRQAAWETHAVRLPGAGLLASALARGHVDPDVAARWAKRDGYGPDSFQALLKIARSGPPLDAAVQALRRRELTPAELETVYTRHAIEQEWWPALNALVSDILDPAQLAAAIHRGLVPDPGLLKGEQPSGPYNVEAYPVYDIDAVQEAEGSGYDRDRLGVLVGLQGLPMGTHEAAQALYRGILTHGDYIRAFNESNSRNEWAQAVLDQARQIPTARDFLENALRGYRTLAEAIRGASLHGMSAEHATMIYQNQGRPMALRQITQALSRGGKFQPEPGELKDPYEAAIVEGSLKPAYYDLAKALRYTLPSPFAMRQLAQSGVWTEAKTAQRLKDYGWLPADADEVAKAWATPASGGSDKWASRAETRIFTLAWSDYLDGNHNEADMRALLAAIGVGVAEQDRIVQLANAARDRTRTDLTQAQILKLYKKAVWTRDRALAALQDIDMTAQDAGDLLDAQ